MEGTGREGKGIEDMREDGRESVSSRALIVRARLGRTREENYIRAARGFAVAIVRGGASIVAVRAAIFCRLLPAARKVE